MAPSKLKSVIGAVKDQTSISLAMVNNSASLSDLEVAIVKATRHDDYPPDERYVREILSLTSYSHSHVSACVNTISRRLSKTRNWVVALKALMLIHRLLTDGDAAYEQEVFFATRRGSRLLNMADFRDKRSNSWDYSAFVRTYALFLDEQLEYRMQGRRGKSNAAFAYHEEVDEDNAKEAIVVRTTPMSEMKTGQIFSRINHLLLILERFLGCKPTGQATTNRIVLVSLYPLVKGSFYLYYDITEILGVLIYRFMELPIPECLNVHEIFCKVSKQLDELDAFYSWSKTVGIARSSEYPELEKIPQKKLDVMNEFIKERSEMRKKKKPEPEPEPEPKEEPEPEPKEEPEPDMNEVKALLGAEEEPEDEPEEEEEQAIVEVKEELRSQFADLLNLGEDAPTTQENSDKLALALFDGAPATAPANGPAPWQAFNDSENWETSLVQSASHLQNQKATLPGGFDTLMLDGMYQQGAVNHAVASSGVTATGSASSVAIGSAGKPAMLALPAPPSANGAPTTNTVTDPFAASVTIAPPPYVQMSEMEKKQQLLVEEQVMWQQYAQDGMQGHMAYNQMQANPYPYNMGGYTRNY
ncbi:hypothetical protein Leryth_018819 [Lithospermum erythrorhizon]|uniref:Vesicle coat protein n=1 Tax=Lithospermum erythrorhizon TaxID=34254 RepID=A0AAV3NYF1_LITER|nr:hypothetical protein Leryth_018819 [Lithospermum erythrorhizon]